MKICSRCILPESFPGISFDDEGVCSYCHRESRAIEQAPEKKIEYRKRLDNLMEQTKGLAPTYDAVIAYSGGKDSSYTLKLLRQRYDLRILAVTLDNHFVSPRSWDNITAVCNTLNVDHITFRPPWPVMKALFSLTASRDIFSAPTLLRASSICTACIGIVKNLTLKVALEQFIPLVVFGWSPGQAPIQSAIMKTNAALLRQTQSALNKAIQEHSSNENGLEISRYSIPEIYFNTFKNSFPTNVHPLAFFDYDEKGIKNELSTLGWAAPTDTDTNSSNCLLNSFANSCHLQRHNFHPYVWEIANLVRQAVMDRAEGIEKIYTDQNQTMVNYARERLGL